MVGEGIGVAVSASEARDPVVEIGVGGGILATQPVMKMNIKIIDIEEELAFFIWLIPFLPTCEGNCKVSDFYTVESLSEFNLPTFLNG